MPGAYSILPSSSHKTHSTASVEPVTGDQRQGLTGTAALTNGSQTQIIDKNGLIYYNTLVRNVNLHDSWQLVQF